MAQDQYTQLQIPLARKQQNFAPIRPLQDLLKNKQPNRTPTKFEQSIRKLYQSKMDLEKSAWQELYSMAQLVALFRQGQQLLARRPYGGGYYVRPVASDDTYRQTAMNLMGFHAQVCEAKIVASNPNVNIRAGDDTPQAIATAQACRPVVDCYETDWYTSKFTRREAIYLLTNGMFIHRVRWNPFKGGQSIQSREVNQVQKQTDRGFGECIECQYTSEAVDNTGKPIFTESDMGHQCPECGGASDVKPPSMANMSQISMGQSVPVGEPEIIQTPFPGWRWDLSKDLEDSSWAIYRQRISSGAITMMLGDVVIPDSDSSGDYGLDMLHALNYAGQAFAGNSSQGYYGGGRENDKRPTMAEFWVSAEDQAEIECEEGDTICGVTMPKGRMNEFFKGEPVCLVGLNDMAAVIGTYKGETQKSEVVTGQWIMQSDSGAGRGMEDTAAVQKRFNAVDGQIYQGLATTATPAAITDLSIFKEDQASYLFRPGVNIDVNLALLPPGMKLQDAFYLPNAGNINQQYIQYGSQFLRQMFQLSTFVTEFSDGLVGVDNRTATGAQITAALANSLFGPMLATKGQARVRIAQMIVELESKYNASSRYFAGKGNARGRMVSGKDLKGKVIFELVQNSELPVTPFSQQTDVRVMVESLGGPQGIIMLKQQEPEMFKQLSAPFNYKPEVDSADAVSTLCLERLEQMKAGLKAGVNDPAMLVQGLRPPISMYEPKHPEKKRWWSEFLDLQQGQESPMEIRLAAEQAFLCHQNFDTGLKVPQAVNSGLVEGAQVAAAQAPSALGMAAIQNAQGGGDPNQGADLAHEQQQSQQEDEHESLLHLSDQQHELNVKQLEGQTQLAVTAQQGKNAETTAKIAGDNAVRTAKAKPKVKPAGKAA